MRRAKRTGRVVLLDVRSIRRLEESAPQRRAIAAWGIPVEIARFSRLSRLSLLRRMSRTDAYGRRI